ncbi:UdgX family uracil-DNA binding protein [Actinacidiphila acidipaludis]|uniref:Type-4 uracil-DNA glycosylase n=1 Tax=Actinacidiphila acidipaludis TaxID=2873382 RepID=A0ABS7QGC6_9ACTN|nr:UdgX family uracil-DNA binding protein [Streptomyces acidipaludis]MBY8882233.1 UdgX family uracil-DNA binding protein [Streptomyces acidipaludis]
MPARKNAEPPAGAEGPSDGSGYDATPFLPARGRIPAHRRAAADCRGCPLFGPATQTVFGEGDASARLMFVGEEPGDQEDRQGKPFVGPAGQLLHRAMEEAGLADEPSYVTNAVKHFKFELAPRTGKRRIHKPPSLREMTACRPWLSAELRLVEPEVVVALGATAGRALLGSSFRVTKDRGAVQACAVAADGTIGPVEPDAVPGDGTDHASDGHAGIRTQVVPTVHPSSVLRSDDREAAYAGLVADLRVAAGLVR